MHEIGKWIAEFGKSGLETLVDKAVRPPVEAFMNGHPLAMGIVGIVIAGGVLLSVIVFLASRKKTA